MEDMVTEMGVCYGDVFRGQRVLVTGHTGFKGSWLCEWLLDLGAEVTGLALAPDTAPSLFELLRLSGRMRHLIADVRDATAVEAALTECRPDFVFHLAAQPLVRASYRRPVETYETNFMGTVRLLEALRKANRPCVAVVSTTDKCYRNREWRHGYREEDELGGHDPYSSSKAAAELAIAAYRESFFRSASERIMLASARAGNVVGGGDWAQDRIVPDAIRALTRSEPIRVRNKTATRPWQHVLEPLSGYLWLAACLHLPRLCAHWHASQTEEFSYTLASPFNFGPGEMSNRTVEELVRETLKYWDGDWFECVDPSGGKETQILSLNVSKANKLLGWKGIWNFEETVKNTITWYREVEQADDRFARASDLTRAQIREYVSAAKAQRAAWVA